LIEVVPARQYFPGGHLMQELSDPTPSISE